MIVITSYSIHYTKLYECLDSTLLAHDYLKEGQLVMPFGNLGIPATPHYLCVPKQKLEQEKIQIILNWIKSWLPN